MLDNSQTIFERWPIQRLNTAAHAHAKRVAAIDHPANELYYLGEWPEAWAERPVVAIVGSRKPTTYGRGVTLQLAAALAARDVIVVSGLALGPDALAARGALDGGGTTIAVIGNGLNRIHPHTNQQLAHEILLSGGIVISEYSPNYPVYKGNFLARNRLITALADVVIVVEAGEKSGTLNTAAHALSQNKELMAVPGNITSPLSVGCNRLIAAGAGVVTDVEDILEKLREIFAVRHFAKPGTKLNLNQVHANSKLYHKNNTKLDLTEIRGNDTAETAILRQIASGTADGDAILRATKLKPEEFNVALTMLELQGKIRALGANQWALK
jgi:DNA processing protein